MTTGWTRIHEHLGLAPGPLTFEHVASATDAKLTEADVLDWKGPLPQPPRDGTWNEFTKDVAAMANTRGGLLIYGVGDDHEVSGIDADAVDTRMYGQWLRNHVRPYLADIGYEVLPSADGTRAVLVVEVPASESAPHSVVGGAARDKAQNAFVVPYRDADHTAWMEEHQIARAYRERFTAQDRHDQAITRTWNSTQDLVVAPSSPEAWAIFVAQPVRPLPRLAPKLTRAEVAGILEKSLGASSALCTADGSVVEVIRNLRTQRHNARVGLRSWVVSNAVAEADSSSVRGVYLQLGHDGSLALAVNVSSLTFRHGLPEGVHTVNAEAVDIAAGEFVVLVQLLNQHLHHDSPVGARVGIIAGGESLEFVCAERSSSSFEISGTSRRPRGVQPWTAEILPNDPLEAARASAEALSSAMLNQFGVRSQLYGA